MINPSANGWIEKFFIKQQYKVADIPKLSVFYDKMRDSGFILGHVTALNMPTSVSTEGWTKDEFTKVSLLHSLYQLYQIATGKVNHVDFTEKVVSFYNQISPQGFNLFNKVFTQSQESRLEDVIDERAKTNHDIVSKNFSHLLTNALLFVDILAFQRYLSAENLPEKYLIKTEEAIINIISLALKEKTIKSTHDNLLIKLFESSVRYSKFSDAKIQNLDSLKLEYFNYELEKLYMLDLAAMTLWTDGTLENQELNFFYRLAEKLNISTELGEKSMVATTNFITTHQDRIPYLNHSSAAKNLYDNITQSVIVLITRNKKRLLKEISHSGELMALLVHSTHRDLDSKEKKKVKTQLLEICKTIPSLTIFLLPGGSLLLPILIKFIPKMLPSTFNENYERE